MERGWAVNLYLRPKMGQQRPPSMWRRMLRVLLMLALAAACAWLMTGCEARPGDSPAVHGAVVGLGFFALLGLAFLMGKGSRS